MFLRIYFIFILNIILLFSKSMLYINDDIKTKTMKGNFLKKVVFFQIRETVVNFFQLTEK